MRKRSGRARLSRAGFTLAELVVVLAVLGALMALTGGVMQMISRQKNLSDEGIKYISLRALLMQYLKTHGDLACADLGFRLAQSVSSPPSAVKAITEMTPASRPTPLPAALAAKPLVFGNPYSAQVQQALPTGSGIIFTFDMDDTACFASDRGQNVVDTCRFGIWIQLSRPSEPQAPRLYPPMKVTMTVEYSEILAASATVSSCSFDLGHSARNLTAIRAVPLPSGVLFGTSLPVTYPVKHLMLSLLTPEYDLGGEFKAINQANPGGYSPGMIQLKQVGSYFFSSQFSFGPPVLYAATADGRVPPVHRRAVLSLKRFTLTALNSATTVEVARATAEGVGVINLGLDTVITTTIPNESFIVEIAMENYELVAAGAPTDTIRNIGSSYSWGSPAGGNYVQVSALGGKSR